MRILLLSLLFQPEPNHLKGLAFAKRLQDEGHHVEVLTGFPHYPGGSTYAGYRIRPFQREVLQGVPVTRVALYPSHDTSAFRRFLTYVTFACAASLFGPFLFRRFDVVHVCQGPATVFLPGLLIAWRTRARLVLDIQDIWPESVTSSGMLHNPFLVWILKKWSSLSYKLADEIIVLSQGYKETVCQRGARRDNVHVVYNWMDESVQPTECIPPEYLLKLRRDGKSIILFAGTMGRVQALDAVIAAAELLQASDPEVHLVFVGAGVDVERLQCMAECKRLVNVSFFPRVEASAMQAIFSGTDALLIHLRSDALGKIGIPQKTQAYLAAGKPIVIAVDGEASHIVQSARAGIACAPEDPPGIAGAIRQLFAMPRASREDMGYRGRAFYCEKMSFAQGLQRVLDVYCCATGGRAAERSRPFGFSSSSRPVSRGVTKAESYIR